MVSRRRKGIPECERTPAHAMEANVKVEHSRHSFAGRGRAHPSYGRICLEDRAQNVKDNPHAHSRDEQ